MIKKRHLSAVLTATSLLLAGCSSMPDYGLALSERFQSSETEAKAKLAKPKAPASTNEFSDFLIARYASLTNDPQQAAQRYAGVALSIPGDTSISERAVFSALLANDFDLALSVAKSADESVLSQSSLPRLTLAAHAIASGDYDAVPALTGRERSGPFYALVLGSLEAWSLFGKGNVGPAELTLLDAAGEDPYLRDIMLNSLALMEIAASQDEQALETLGFLEGNLALTAAAAESYARLLASRGEEAHAINVLSVYLEQVGYSPAIEDTLNRIAAGEQLPVRRLTAAEGAALSIYVPAAALAAQSTDDLPGVYYSIALELDPQLHAARALFADALDRSGRSGDAIDMLRAIPDASPYHVTAIGQLAWALHRTGMDEEALTLAMETLAEDPERDLKIQIADLLTSLEADEAALSAFTEVISGDEAQGVGDWRLYYARGTLNERLGNWPDAETDFLTAKALNPSSPEVLNHLGYSWVDRGLHLERGMDLIRQALSLRPNSGAITDSLGWGYYKLGDFDQAVYYLELAAEIEPDLAEIVDHLGDAYWMTGRRTEARFQWEKVLTLLKEDEQEIRKIERKMLTGPETQAASRDN
ncbi:hypothetical protein D1224_02045 [Henriciella barbarensis]|uniref:Tetratricopeptide repeat protein n=1 Tax=Henriciella barbarensis TaxID=86342 RepID=A0A399R3U9_9PROT|nr:tetratricopeptide repeat protein [Henriciella barbarensis]RIJ25920.1 hypothetical protein D1224_02045 [Henriciella barbarensis]